MPVAYAAALVAVSLLLQRLHDCIVVIIISSLLVHRRYYCHCHSLLCANITVIIYISITSITIVIVFYIKYYYFIAISNSFCRHCHYSCYCLREFDELLFQVIVLLFLIECPGSSPLVIAVLIAGSDSMATHRRGRVSGIPCSVVHRNSFVVRQRSTWWPWRTRAACSDVRIGRRNAVARRYREGVKRKGCPPSPCLVALVSVRFG